MNILTHAYKPIFSYQQTIKKRKSILKKGPVTDIKREQIYQSANSVTAFFQHKNLFKPKIKRLISKPK